MAEDFPLAGMEADALAPARLLGVVATYGNGCPNAVVSAAQMTPLTVPRYARHDSWPVRLAHEPMCDHVVADSRG